MPVTRITSYRLSALALLVAASVSFGACSASLPVSTDDASITARVRTVLLNDPEVGANQINVTTAGGVVTISGSVDSSGDAQRAVDLARGVAGVRDVQSSLEVTP